jgi:hypothetical protein
MKRIELGSIVLHGTLVGVVTAAPQDERQTGGYRISGCISIITGSEHDDIKNSDFDNIDNLSDIVNCPLSEKDRLRYIEIYQKRSL